MSGSLSVWWHGAVVGDLVLDEHGDLGFAYNATWLEDETKPAISASLPKQAEVFNRRQTRPFFAGLLPEQAVLESVARKLGLSATNDFQLLRALGGEVAGALSLWPEGEVPAAYSGQAGNVALGDDELIGLIDEMPRRPFLAGDKELRLSLAGAQAKLPVVLIGDRIALPVQGQPTTHILKPPMPRFFATTENEAFSMQLAAAIGLDVAPALPQKVRDRTYLLVTRYDRQLDRSGGVRRLHQEDFCQAMGISPEHKYAAEGGPTFKTSFELLRHVTPRPAVETLKLLDAALFNLIVGNADAHGKNFSLLYDGSDTRLAPLYDLMCTAAYPDVATRLAMQFIDASDLKEFTPHLWDRFAKTIEVGAPYFRRRFIRLGQLVHQQAEHIAAVIAKQGFDRDALEGFAEIAKSRSAKLLEQA